jgi:hypothetical protein
MAFKHCVPHDQEIVSVLHQFGAHLCQIV